nr:unnamed protein product [Callosobruchus chinensis]
MLISLSSERVLWDPKYEQYFSRHKKEDALRDISMSMEIDVEEIRKKMTSLLGSFWRERSKEKISSIIKFVLLFSRFLYLSLIHQRLFLLDFVTFFLVEALASVKPAESIQTFCGDAMLTSYKRRLKTKIKTARLAEQ